MADNQEPDFDKKFESIRKNEQAKTHHECRCRDCDPITAMAERADAFKIALGLLHSTTWHEEDQPSVREAMTLADWLMYGSENAD